MREDLVGYGSVPGASFTEELGTAAWQKPPKYVKPTEAFSDFVDIASKKKVYERIIFSMEEGIPVEGLANTIMYNMVAGGKCSYDVGLLMLPHINDVIEAMAKSAEIEYTLKIPEQVDTTFAEAQLNRIMEQEDEVEIEEEELAEKEPAKEVKDRPKKGLMGA